jgi:type III secretion system FlhB-like substrate exporter
MRAPRVVAKGADLAFNIRRVAEAHKVPIRASAVHARSTSEIGEEISQGSTSPSQVLTYLSAHGPTVNGAKRAEKPAAKPRSVPKRPEIAIDADLLEPQRGRVKKPEVRA